MNINPCGANKPDHFIDLYSETLKHPRSILEIGVQTGNSLIMWKNAFPYAKISGFDIQEPTNELPEDITFIKGNHDDLQSLNALGKFDLIIDDGSHKTGSQQFMLEILWDHVNPGGQYVIEDLETSYMERFINSPINTVEVLKEMLDTLNNGESGIKRITFEEDIVIIDKR